MITHSTLRLVASIALTVGAAHATAQTLADVGPTVGSSTNYSLAYSNGSTASGTYAPGRRMTWNGGSTFTAYCIDPMTGTDFTNAYTATSLASFLNGTTTSGYAQQISRAGYTNSWTATPVVGAPGALSNSSTAQGRVLADLQELFGWAYNDSQTSAVKAAAFGMAVWEIMLQDGGTTSATTYSRTAGRLRSDGSTVGTADTIDNQVNAYLSALNGNTWTTLLGATAAFTNWTYTVYYDASSPFSQSFLRVTQQVPEPATLALVGLGLLGAGAVRRRAVARRG